MTPVLIQTLRTYATRYETPAFLKDDPSQFMHQVSGDSNRETTAFVASCLSYGSRKQFLPKMQSIIDAADGDVFHWIREGEYRNMFKENDKKSFYRLYNYHTMAVFFEAVQEILQKRGSLKDFIWAMKSRQAIDVLEELSAYFYSHGLTGIVPRPRTSCCKRPCMLLRWMVRCDSPVDLGLWSDIVDRASLFIPLDTHVAQSAVRLGLLDHARSSWHTVEILTKKMREVFPDDPSRGDFALYGFDIDQ